MGTHRQKKENTTKKKSKEKAPTQTPRDVQLWEDLHLDESSEESAVEDVIQHEKNTSKHRWLRRVVGFVLLCLVFFGLMNFEFLATKIEYKLFPPKQKIVSEAPATTENKQEIGKANQIEIKNLGISAPVLYSESKSEVEFQKLLESGVVHYPGTAKPGEVGNVYIFGHSSDYLWSKGKFKTVFALLPELEIGSEIKLSNQEGEVFTYIVKDKFVAEKTDLELLSQDTGGESWLTLQTSYPIGTALKRYIVKADVVN